MISKLEKKIRESDISSKGIMKMSRLLAKKFKKSVETIHKILIAKRQGYYRKYSWEQDLAKQKGFSSLNHYRNYRAIINGFLDDKDYRNYLGKRLKGICKSKKEYFKIVNLGGKLKYFASDLLDKLPQINKNEAIEELSDLLEKSLKDLNNKQREVIKMLYYNDFSLRKAGKEINLSGERIRQIELEALNKLYFIGKKYKLDEI